MFEPKVLSCLMDSLKKKTAYLVYLCLLLIMVEFSCEKKRGNAKEEAGKINVTVSIVPHGMLVKKIGAGYVNVNILIPNGVNHETYEPSPKQFESLSNSGIYFLAGANHPFEKRWVEKFSRINPALKFVSLSEGVKLIKLTGHHSHEGEKDEKDKLNIDPHTWLSPLNLIEHIKVIKDTLKTIAPEHSAIFETNGQLMIERMAKLDKELFEILKASGGKKFITFHPFWGYFAQRYNLQQLPVELEGKEPSGNYLTRIIEEAKKEGIKLVVSSPQFNRKSAEIIAKEISGHICNVDPMSEEYEETLLNLARNISEGEKK